MHLDTDDTEVAGKKANLLLFRSQLKAHNSMLKVIENNCESNSLRIFPYKQKSIFDRNVARKTNVAVWPCRCPFRSIKRNAVSRESDSTLAAEQLRFIAHCCFFVCCFPQPRLFNQIKTSDDGLGEIFFGPRTMLSRNLHKKLTLTAFVCYDYLTVNGSRSDRCVLLFTCLQSLERDASSKLIFSFIL